MKKIKILLTYTFAGVISCATISTNAATGPSTKNCCSISRIPCTTNSDCSDNDRCVQCTLNPDPVECPEPKIYSLLKGACVCPNLKSGVNPTCENGTFDEDSCTCFCNAGYYQNGDACNKCPDNGTSAAGATSITQCYVTTFSDATGSGVYTSNCYYKE